MSNLLSVSLISKCHPATSSLLIVAKIFTYDSSKSTTTATSFIISFQWLISAPCKKKRAPVRPSSWGSISTLWEGAVCSSSMADAKETTITSRARKSACRCAPLRWSRNPNRRPEVRWECLFLCAVYLSIPWALVFRYMHFSSSHISIMLCFNIESYSVWR